MDDGERFGFFSRAVVKMLDHLEFWPDVIHCNDWQTALIPIYLKDDGVREERYRSIRTVLTIHNIEYQGRYDPDCLGDLFGLDRGWVDDGTLLLDGDLNLLKGAILTRGRGERRVPHLRAGAEESLLCPPDGGHFDPVRL